MKPKKTSSIIWKAVGFGVVLLIAALLGLWLQSTPGKSTYVSPDGKYRVQLVEYHFTTNRVVYTLPPKSTFDRVFGAKANSFRRLLHLQLPPASSTVVCTPDLSGEPALSAAFVIQGPFDGLRLAVADGAGNEFDPVVQYLAHPETSYVGEAPAFPRRAKNLRLKLLTQRGKIAEFKIPNPAFQIYPQWQPQTLPATVTNGNLEVSLTRFETWNPGAATYSEPNIYPKTVCRFAIAENGSPTVDWRATSFELFDATGNHWRALWDSRFDKADGAEIVAGFLGGLWPGEHAWKMKVEFKRIGHFQEEELLRLDGIPVPGTNQFFEPKTKYKVNGAYLELSSLVGPNVDWGSLFRRHRDPVYARIYSPIINDRFTILIKCQSPAQDRRLVLISATDERRAAIKSEIISAPTPPAGMAPSAPPYWLALTPPPGARTVNLVFAVTRSVVAEFMAKPVQIVGSGR